MPCKHRADAKHTSKLLRTFCKTFDQIQEDLTLEKSGNPLLRVDCLVREVMWYCFTFNCLSTQNFIFLAFQSFIHVKKG